jgi:hypothetical protein
MSATERFDEPEIDNLARDEVSLLPKNWTRPPWVYLHGALGWECICTGDNPEDPKHYEWLPLLGRSEGIDGAGGVSYNKQTQRYNFAGALAGHATFGTRGIEPSDGRLGEFRNYNARFYRCIGGGKRYVEPGERLTKLSNGSVNSRPDHAKTRKFLRLLKANGLVEPMQVEVFEAFVKTIENRVVNLKRLARPGPLADALHKLACYRAAWAKEVDASKADELEVEMEAEPVAEGTAPAAKRDEAGVPQARKAKS